MIRILLFCLSFTFLFVFNLGAKDDLDDIRTQDNRYLIDNSYKNFVENFNSLNEPVKIENADFAWRNKFLYNNKVINLPCAYILHLQDQFLRSVDRKQAESIAHLLKLTQIDGFYFAYQKQRVTRKQAQILALMFERSNIFTNIVDQKSDNVYAQAVNQHFYLVKNDYKKLQEWQDIKDTNKFNDNLWINLSKLGDDATKKRIDLIKGLSLLRRNIMPKFILENYLEQIKKNNFLGFDYRELVNFSHDVYIEHRSLYVLGEYIQCEFCGYFDWGKNKSCKRCKKHLCFEAENDSRISKTANSSSKKEAGETRVNPSRCIQIEHVERHTYSRAWGTREVVREYKSYRPMWIAEMTEKLMKVTTQYYGFSAEQKTAIRQDLSKQSLMFKKRRLVYLVFYLKNRPVLRFRREILAEIAEYLLEYKRHEDTFFKYIKPAFLLKEATVDVWEIQH